MFADGVRLLGQPVLPLVSLVADLYLEGEAVSVAGVLAGLPGSLEVAGRVYDRPREALRGYRNILAGLEALRQPDRADVLVVDENDQLVDPETGLRALVIQNVLTRELERINSLLCAPCGCTLCCIGPDGSMAQEFFEIPLTEAEAERFSLRRCDCEASRARRSGDPEELMLDGSPFYRAEEPLLVRWRTGWSMILPKLSRCPNLEEQTGRCLVYDTRPEVCRRPQIFPYMVEPLEEDPERTPVYRIRRSLLAVTDCPYVAELAGEIRGYGEACGLQVVFNRNKV